ncbi:hypothetical protein [Novilysobacter erysipheiresistens]|uniref:DUF2188 domain-containing protein n=1 Tax=Novilysobacter erysipheiresistens TaxID=1749332 RepID=A0ABU7YVW2_9GAMM
MQPVTYSVIRIGQTWTVRCSHEIGRSSSHGDRSDALRTAEQAALAMWKEHSAASRVVVDDDSGRWLAVAQFGQMLG